MVRTAVKKQKSASAPKKKKTPKTKKTPKKKKTPVKKKKTAKSSSSSSTKCGQKPERLAQHRRSLDGPVVYLLKLM